MVPIALTQTAQRSQSRVVKRVAVPHSPHVAAHSLYECTWLWAAPGAARPGGRPLCELSHLE